MKRRIALILTGVFALALTACGATPAITAEEALNIALEQAGVTRDSIRGLENNLDEENGVLVYEIDFESGNIEYSFDVNAETGAIVERDRDLDN